VLERVTAAQLKADILNASPSLLRAYDQSVRTLHSLSLRLRVCPQARLGLNALKKPVPDVAA
jgi:hypothetical protein